MSEEEIERLEELIPAMAVEALNAASRRAREAGLPVVVVEGNQLVRIVGTERVVLRELPPRLPVTDRVKRATA